MNAMSASPTSVLIDARDVSMSFDVSSGPFQFLKGRRRVVHALDKVSFTIKRGETLALVGESGCGKSTLARVLVGLYTPTSGAIQFDGQSIPAQASSREKSLRRRIQMIFQDPYTSLNPRWRVGDSIAEPMEEHGIGDPDTRTKRVGQLLEQVGLSQADAAKYPHQFSGGQRQRIAIARALSTQPEFLVCDEPTSALDVSVQAQVLNLMQELQDRSNGLTYLFISHNLAVVHHIADRVGVMYLGRLVELAPKSELFSAPLHPYTRMLLDVVPKLKRPSISRAPIVGEVPNPINPPSGCTFHPRCPLAQERCRVEVPQMKSQAKEDPRPARLIACHAIEEGRA